MSTNELIMVSFFNKINILEIFYNIILKSEMEILYFDFRFYVFGYLEMYEFELTGESMKLF